MKATSRRFLLALFLPLALVIPSTPLAQSEEGPVRVATTLCPPFVISSDGQFTGLSIFLWDRVARELGVEYEIAEYTLKQMLDAVAQGDADLGVSCLSITQEREKMMDFSHSFYETHLAIAVKQHGYLEVIKGFFASTRVLVGIGLFIAAAALIGIIFFLLEHKINAKLYSMKSRGGKMLEAFVVGLLFITRGPIRYYEFRTSTARVLSAILSAGSTLIIAGITALLASAFTLEHLRSNIAGPQDLSAVRVGALEASTSSDYLEEQGIAYRTFGDLEELVAALEGGSLDAVVSDAAFLKYAIRNAQKQGRYEALSVLPYQFEEQNYGFALEEQSPHVETLNQALLAVRASPEWKKELAKYLGE